MIWNAINDPLFGWIQDQAELNAGNGASSRVAAIRWGGPLFALSFLLPWFAWTNDTNNEAVIGMHFIVSLCVFDGMFTYVALAQCALFADVETDQAGRSMVLATTQIASLLGSLAVVFSYIFWEDTSSLFSFQLFTILLACLSCFGFMYTGNHLHHTGVHRPRNVDNVTPRQLVCPILKHRGFLLFICVNFLQIYQNTVNANFFNLFMDKLLPAFPVFSRSAILASSSFLPQLLSLMLSSYATTGTYFLIRTLFLVKLLMSLVICVLGRHATSFLALFLVFGRGLGDATFSFFNMVISDLIDADFAKHNRPRRMGSMYFGMNALFTKPAQSIAPMVVVGMLAKHGFTQDSPVSSVSSVSESALGIGSVASDVVGGTELQDAMFYLLWVTPCICTPLQLLLWKFFPRKEHKVYSAERPSV